MANDTDEPERRRGRQVLQGLREALDASLPLPSNHENGSQFDERVARSFSSDGDDDRIIVKFGMEWRRFIRAQTPDRLAALGEVIDDRIEKRALAKFYRRMKHLTVAVVLGGFAVAQFGVDKWPLIQRVVAIIRGDGVPK